MMRSIRFAFAVGMACLQVITAESAGEPIRRWSIDPSFQSEQTSTSTTTSTMSPIGFAPTTNMTSFRAGHTATLLRNGVVLLVGGRGGRGDSLNRTSELYEPSSRTFTPIPSVYITSTVQASAREHHTATLLTDDTVLITGGYDGYALGPNDIPLASSALYNPVTQMFTTTGSLSTARGDHTATALATGEVLIAGGSDASHRIASVELYDPVMRNFTAIGDLTTPRQGHSATLLPDGTVLIVGGSAGSGPLASAELYHPATQKFTPTGTLATPRQEHSATLLLTGKVLIVGGGDGSTAFTSAELYDPITKAFTPTGNLGIARQGHTATLLPDGRVLLISGTTSELYYPDTGTFQAAGRLAAAPYVDRINHAATLLPDGTVLVSGGEDKIPSLVRATVSAELSIAQTHQHYLPIVFVGN